MSEPQQRVQQRLVPTAFRLAAVIVIAVCALTLAVLSVMFFHSNGPDSLDNTVANFLQPGGPGGFRGFGGFGSGGGGSGRPSGVGFELGPLARLGGPGPITLFTALLCYCCIAMRRYRGAIMLAVAVIVASALTEFVLKPMIDRTYTGDLSFPSGHATAIFALATAIVLLLADSQTSVMPTSLRLVLSVCAVGVACAVALGLVASGDHYFTDTVGGAAVGIGVTLACALVLDRLGVQRERTPEASPAPAGPARVG